MKRPFLALLVTPILVIAVTVLCLRLSEDINQVDTEGRSLLMRTIIDKDNDIARVEALLKKGIDVNIRDAKGRTALMLLAETTDNPALISLLLNAKADVNALDNNNASVLAYAARNPSLKITAMLVKAGADINGHPRRNAPLAIALEHNPNPEVSTYLIKAGARMSCDSLFRTAMRAAASNQNPGILEMLVKMGVGVNYKDSDGETLLTRSIQNQNLGMLKKTLELGAHVNVQDNMGLTPLMRAIMRQPENPECISLLIKSGADIKIKDKEGRVALDYARNLKLDEQITNLLDIPGYSVMHNQKSPSG